MEPGRWYPPNTGSESIPFEDFNRYQNKIPHIPSVFSLAFTEGRLGVVLTIGDVAFFPGNRYYRIYFIPKSMLSESAARDPFLLNQIVKSFPIVGEIAHPNEADVTFTDFDHVNVPGWYTVTARNMKGDESDPCRPINNPIDPSEDQTGIPINAASVTVTKTSEIPPGSQYYDTIYTIETTPSPSKYCIGFQVVIFNYQNDGLPREAIFIGCEGGLVNTITGTLRLPSDAAGHTITFYVVPQSTGGGRDVYTACTSTTIASGP